MQAGPSHTGTGFDDRIYNDIYLTPHHARSISRMALIEPLRTTTQTQIWLDQHRLPQADLGIRRDAEKGYIRSRSCSEGSEDKVGYQVADREEEEDLEDAGVGMPLLIRPLHSSIASEDGSQYHGVIPWLRPEDIATEWLSLFYGQYPSNLPLEISCILTHKQIW
jgi:hypothetical protein